MTPGMVEELRARFTKFHGREPPDDDELWLFQRDEEARARAAKDTGLANFLPRIAIAAAAGAVITRPKIWLAEFESFNRGVPFYPSAWLGEVTDSIKANRKKGEPSAKVLAFGARKFADEASHTNHGFVVMAFRFIADLLLCWPGTAQLVVAWLVQHGHLQPQGTRVRDGKMIVNGPNGYILQMLGDVPTEPEIVQPDDPAAAKLFMMRRMAQSWEHWRPRFWKLVQRPTGWANTSPLRTWKDDDPLPA